MTGQQRQELRRHPRAEVNWPVIAEVGHRLVYLQATNLSPLGAKCTGEERLEEGKRARLHFRPPAGPPVAVEAVVWRTDADGTAFFFLDFVPQALLAASGVSARLGG